MANLIDLTHRTLLVFLLVTFLASVSLALRCFVCLPNASTAEDCRQISNRIMLNCTKETKHCVAVVLANIKGDITVYRGCANDVISFKLPGNECTMLDNLSDDLPAAYYKCKTDGCNNIEPVTSEVTESINTPDKKTPSRVSSHK